MTSSRGHVGIARKLLVGCTFALAGAASFAYAPEVHAQRSASDIESARQLYNQGIELRDKGDVKGAFEKFRAAHALGNTPITGLELCKSYAALHQPVEAREMCMGVARIPPTAQETARSQEARNEAGRIAEEQRPKIGGIRVRLTGVPEGREPTVTIDGATVPAAALGEPRAVNPGVHTITARVGQGAETRATLETREGEQRELPLAVQPPPADEPPPPGNGGNGGDSSSPQPQERKGKGIVTAAFIVGGVGVTIGLVTGLVAMAAKSDLDDRCPEKACGPESYDDLDAGKTWGTVSTVSFVIGGVALVGGLVGLITSSPKSSAPSTGSAAKAAKASSPSSPLTLKTSSMAITPSFGLGGAGIHGSF